MKTQCPHCKGENLSWFCTTHNSSDAQDGRLRMHDVEAKFVLGCDDCSETVQVVSGDKIAAHLNQLRKQTVAI